MFGKTRIIVAYALHVSAFAVSIGIFAWFIVLIVRDAHAFYVAHDSPFLGVKLALVILLAFAVIEFLACLIAWKHPLDDYFPDPEGKKEKPSDVKIIKKVPIFPKPKGIPKGSLKKSVLAKFH